MSLVCNVSQRSSCCAATGKRFTGVVVTLLVFLFSASVHAYDMPKNLGQGWDGDVQFGALATFGPTDSSAITARSTLTYSSKRWEHELDIRLHRSANEALVSRRDSDGQVMRDANDKEIQDLVSSTTNDRRFVSGQSRWFFTSKHYVFLIADLDVNTPANLDYSTRQISGLGYKLYRSKKDLISAQVGLGRKMRVEVDGDSELGPIAYIGFRFKREISEKLVLALDLDSDFGGDNRFSEAEASLSWKLRDPVSLKLKYGARFNSTVIDPLNTFDDGLEAALSVNIAVEVF